MYRGVVGTLTANSRTLFCRHTRVLQDFAELHQRFGAELKIVAFPCNQFLYQEPKGVNDIKSFVKSKGFRGGGRWCRLTSEVDIRG